MKKVLIEKLNLQQEIEMERAHYAGKSEGDRPRPIVMRFLKYKDRSSILQRTKALKASRIYINEDFTEAVGKRRKKLMPELKAAHKRGDTAYLR